MEHSGRVETVFFPNSGRLKELLLPGRPVFLVERANPRRKTSYDLIMAFLGETMVWVDARMPNHLVEEALIASALPSFKGYSILRREAPFRHSRLDFLLAKRSERCLLEVKSVTLVRQGMGLFPDAPTERGRRHLNELVEARRQGFRAGVIFVIQREDAQGFSPNDTIDPEFGSALRQAVREGVEAYAYRCHATLQEIVLAKEVSIFLQ